MGRFNDQLKACFIAEYRNMTNSYRDLYKFFVGTIATTITIPKTIPITTTITLS